MAKLEWTEIEDGIWTTPPGGDGVYGRVSKTIGDDGEVEFWAMTCVAEDIPCDPIETSEVLPSLEDAQDFVEGSWQPASVAFRSLP